MSVRAQALIIKKEYQQALNDLNQAIAVAKQDKTVLAQAYAQRAVVKTLMEKPKQPISMFESDLTDDAMEDFKKAASFGNAFAKRELIRCNPYAKMCNAMLAEAMKKEPTVKK